MSLYTRFGLRSCTASIALTLFISLMATPSLFSDPTAEPIPIPAPAVCDQLCHVVRYTALCLPAGPAIFTEYEQLDCRDCGANSLCVATPDGVTCSEVSMSPQRVRLWDDLDLACPCDLDKVECLEPDPSLEPDDWFNLGNQRVCTD